MGILQRYVWGEVFRAFAMALITMTGIFVLFMVAAEAMNSHMLSPRDILHLVPFIIPSTLPYTTPVSLLFAVTVVYGRIAGDNEIIAVKTAGLSVMTVIWPTILLGAVVSVSLWQLSRTWIPASAHQAKMVLFRDLEDVVYKFLKRDKQFSLPGSPFFIKVLDVEDRVLIQPTFKQKKPLPDGGYTYTGTIQAKTARLRFDLDRKVVVVYLEGAEAQNHGGAQEVTLLPESGHTFEIPFPEKKGEFAVKSIQEHTNAELNEELANAREHLANDRRREAIGVGLLFAAGKMGDVKWGDVHEVFAKNLHWKKKCDELETEKQLRTSMAFGSLLFVVLGAPIGIRFAKRDFLSAFMTCFLPIIGLYYPLMLLGINMGKEGTMAPYKALWISNLVLALLAGWVYPRIIKY
ncbi:LptF/LptG family permease [Planctomyces sp. SH-PL62]|uniref:LptF/LptG family permease n=1 Tax=Planctomyces sp. SH-PL62 TaxID=1636152 RepID=UPI00078D670F|nr:LptF/LptG family permease [Planctomyces sp. SH-PL62]AMV39606.1 putative permease YjgP/YjgQ family protein [Planctomyces sp. SH-PL62]